MEYYTAMRMNESTTKNFIMNESHKHNTGREQIQETVYCVRLHLHKEKSTQNSSMLPEVQTAVILLVGERQPVGITGKVHKEDSRELMSRFLSSVCENRASHVLSICIFLYNKNTYFYIIKIHVFFLK